MIRNLSSRDMDRRRFLRMGGALSGLGAVSPFAMQLAAAGSVAAASAPDYKALVCIFLYGGNDSNNMVVPTDQDSYNRYWQARFTGDQPIALMPVGTTKTAIGQVSPVTGRTVTIEMPEAWGGLLPIEPKTANPVPAGTSATARTFGLHPMMGPAQALFNIGRLGVMANVGTLIHPTTRADFENNNNLPANLFSHNDQSNMWQSGGIEGTDVGWGGKMADMIVGGNGQNSLFTAITTQGNTVFLSGENTLQFPINVYGNPAQEIDGTTGWLYGSDVPSAELKKVIQDQGSTSWFANDHAHVVARALSSTDIINTAFQGPLPAGLQATPAYINPFTTQTSDSNFIRQMHAVAQMVAAGPGLGLKRQVFFVAQGGYDTHTFQNQTQPLLMAELSQGLRHLDQALSNVGGIDMRGNVTAFTASDFSRTYSTNGDGTDHAWGGHQLIWGGAVKGKDMYGQFPTVGIDKAGFHNPNISDSAMIPTTSVDQYAATMGRWFGVGDSDLHAIFPNLGNFSTPYLNFL